MNEAILPALCVAFAASCVWLTVRIVNRRERWAKWAMAVLIGLPVMYAASFGPACWWFSSVSELPHATLPAFRRVPMLYRPIGWTARRGPRSLRGVISWYATFGLRDEVLECETGSGDQYNIMCFEK